MSNLAYLFPVPEEKKFWRASSKFRGQCFHEHETWQEAIKCTIGSRYKVHPFDKPSLICSDGQEYKYIYSQDGNKLYIDLYTSNWKLIDTDEIEL